MRLIILSLLLVSCRPSKEIETQALETLEKSETPAEAEAAPASPSGVAATVKKPAEPQVETAVVTPTRDQVLHGTSEGYRIRCGGTLVIYADVYFSSDNELTGWTYHENSAQFQNYSHVWSREMTDIGAASNEWFSMTFVTENGVPYFRSGSAVIPCAKTHLAL